MISENVYYLKTFIEESDSLGMDLELGQVTPDVLTYDKPKVFNNVTKLVINKSFENHRFT